MSTHPPHVRHPDLADRFSALLEQVGVADQFDRIYPMLVERYSEPDRYYHTLNHIRHCLDMVDEVRDLLHESDAVELALWFHDVVYDPKADDNEARSAMLFDRELGYCLSSKRADAIHAMIMDTIHPSEADTHDGRFVADIDVSSLALAWPEFLRDAKSLRREAGHLTDAQFQTGQVAFFEKLLSRRSIYLTEYFREHYEQRARRNVNELIGELQKEDGGSDLGL